jgi:hypothetical protein
MLTANASSNFFRDLVKAKICQREASPVLEATERKDGDVVVLAEGTGGFCDGIGRLKA